jgi:DNA invertase Pin-like site-specific DNA recombinase
MWALRMQAAMAAARFEVPSLSTSVTRNIDQPDAPTIVVTTGVPRGDGVRIGQAHRGQNQMPGKARKSRPNKIPIALSDALAHDVLNTNRTRRRRAMIVGYARTSTFDQAAGLAAQERDLKLAGAERVFGEQVSSVAKRAKLAECLAFLREGDVLTVTKPDRLARSAAELLTIEADLSKRGIGLVILSMGGQRLDTRNPTSKLMLTILAGVATWEREIMLERQREGIAKAKAAGKYKGRPVSIDAAEIRKLSAEMGPAAIAKKLGIARSSVYRLLG